MVNEVGEIAELPQWLWLLIDNKYTVTRTVYAATEDDVKTFEEKLKKREERKKHAAKKSEGNNDNNGSNGSDGEEEVIID